MSDFVLRLIPRSEEAKWFVFGFFVGWIGYYSAIKDVFRFNDLNTWGIIMAIGMLTAILYGLYRANEILKMADKQEVKRMTSPKEKRLKIIRNQCDELKEQLEEGYSTWVESSELELVVITLKFLQDKKMLNSTGEKVVKEFNEWASQQDVF